MKRRKGLKRSRLKWVSKSPKRKTELEADKLWKQICLDRDNNRCRCCGGPASTVHHIWRKAKGLYPKLRHELANGLSVCVGCHFTIHMDAERGRDMVIKAIGLEAWEALKRMALLSRADGAKYDPKMALLSLKVIEKNMEGK